MANTYCEQILSVVENGLRTLDTTGYFKNAKIFKLSEDECNMISSLQDEPQGKNAVIYLNPIGSIDEENFYEQFRKYSVEILFKFYETNLELAIYKKRTLFERIASILWRLNNSATIQPAYYIANQTGEDNDNPTVSLETQEMDGNLRNDGKILIHRGSQVWEFH